MTLLDPFVASAWTVPAIYGNPALVTVPAGTRPGDVMLMVALGRSANFAAPAGWTTWWSATGSGEGSFSTPLVAAIVAPDPVPATYTLTPTPSFDWSANIATYRGGLLLPINGSTDGLIAFTPGSGHSIDSASTTSSADPGTTTAVRDGKCIIVIAANSGNNGEIVNYSSGSWRGVATQTGNSRITTAIFDIDQAAGGVDHPAISMSRTEPRAYYAFPFYPRHVHEVVSY